MIVIQHGIAEVVVEVTINTVNVIGIILCVVVLNQERWALNEIVMRFPGLQTAGPDEVDVFPSGTVDAVQILICEASADTTNVFAHESHECVTLRLCHCRCRNTSRMSTANFAQIAGCESAHGLCQEIGDFSKAGPALFCIERFRQGTAQFGFIFRNRSRLM